MKEIRVFIFLIVLTSINSIIISCSKEDVEEIKKETPVEKEKFTIDSNKTFVHPGLLHSQSDFDRIRTKVNESAEPWLSGWNKLISNSHASLTYNSNPVEKLIRGGNSAEEPDADNYSYAMNDAAAAYQLAIRWKVSEDDDYADKAIEILNAWASTCTSISGNSNIALAAGLYGYQFANAAEIMRTYGGWDAADFSNFKEWILNVFYSVSYQFLETHWGTCKSHYWANWDLCNIANVMSIGILCDSAEIYNYALDYLTDGVGNGNLNNCVNYIHEKSANDEIELGQLQESGRDQGHTLLCVGLLGVICQTAYNHGDDVYGYDDNKILKGAEYAAKYNFAGLNVPFTEYIRYYKDAWSLCGGEEIHTSISESGRGGLRPIWELIYNYYVVEKGISAPYVTMAAQLHRAEGGGGDYGSTSGGFDQLGFGTLLYTKE